MSGHLDYNWDTNEMIGDILNSEDLYLTFTDRGWSSDEIRNWVETNHRLFKRIDIDEVDWDQVADFLAEEVLQ